MISVNDFKTGVTVDIDGVAYQVVEFQHVKPGKGAAFVRAKLKNLVTGGSIEKTFRGGEKIPRAHLDKKEMQYLYNDGDLYYFFDPETYDQIPYNKDLVEECLPYLLDGMTVTAKFFKDQIFSVAPPLFVTLEVTETEPAIQGDTSKASYKPAKLETGLTVQVPLFIGNGEKIKIDTRTGEYVERA